MRLVSGETEDDAPTNREPNAGVGEASHNPRRLDGVTAPRNSEATFYTGTGFTVEIHSMQQVSFMDQTSSSRACCGEVCSGEATTHKERPRSDLGANEPPVVELPCCVNVECDVTRLLSLTRVPGCRHSIHFRRTSDVWPSENP